MSKHTITREEIQTEYTALLASSTNDAKKLEVVHEIRPGNIQATYYRITVAGKVISEPPTVRQAIRDYNENSI